MGNENALGETKVMRMSRTGEECKISVDGGDVEEVGS